MPNEENQNKSKSIIKIVFKGVALASGIAVVVLSALDKIDVGSGLSMLGIGVLCLALNAFTDKD